MSLDKQRKGQEGVRLVLLERRPVRYAARVVGLSLDDLKRCLTLHAQHGEAIFASDAAQRFELELFKLKYPKGGAQVTFKRALITFIQENKVALWRALLVMTLIESGILLRWLWDWEGFEGCGTPIYYFLNLPPVDLNAGVFQFVLSLSFFPICFILALSWLTLRELRPLRLIGGKLEHASYIRARRHVEQHEHVGALQVAQEAGHGGLAIAHERGERCVLEHDSASAHERVEVEAEQVYVTHQRSGQ